MRNDAIGDIKNARQILGVSEYASRKQLRQAYRRLALQKHPDVQRVNLDKQRQHGEDRRTEDDFVVLRKSYELLLRVHDDAEDKRNKLKEDVIYTKRKYDTHGSKRYRDTKTKSNSSINFQKQLEKWLMVLILAWPMSYIVCVCFIIIRNIAIQ